MCLVARPEDIASAVVFFASDLLAGHITGQTVVIAGGMEGRLLWPTELQMAPTSDDYCGGRVNCVCPGWTIVPRTAAKLRNTKAVRRVTATMALKTVARPEDIASAAVFLASDSLAGHITGQTIVIAGGMEGRLLWSTELQE